MKINKICVGDLVTGVNHKSNAGYTFSAVPESLGLVIKVTGERMAHVLYNNHVFIYAFEHLKIVSKCINTSQQKAA